MFAVSRLKLKYFYQTIFSGKIFVCDKRGKWHLISDTFAAYVRLAVFHGATIGWQNGYSPLGMSIKAKETLWFNFSSKPLKEDITDTSRNRLLTHMLADSL